MHDHALGILLVSVLTLVLSSLSLNKMFHLDEVQMILYSMNHLYGITGIMER